ncbi:permease prefix domain 1-containing protein [Pseudonocardia dioxanivorans]|uniref:permease prefix domain 1-containing protein n=1 Tax=Pseudonocardia dioxanivorans TaxID=240495 RepID=UPI000CD31ADD|nr:permease prefix domain 1-containing protein [Pseudonocardia dioxanivorans]
MAGHRMTAPVVDPIDAHLGALGAALHGPGRLRASLLAEARDGLEDAAESLSDNGVPRAEARRRAVAEFGEVAELAPGYQHELAAAQGRRTATLIAVTFPALVLGWALFWTGTPSPPERTWASTVLFHVETGASLVAAALAIGTLAALRRARPIRALGLITLVGTITPLVCVAAGLGMAVLNPAHSGSHLPGYLATSVVLVALVSSLTRAHRVLVRTRRVG